MKKLRHILARPDKDLRKLPRIPVEILRIIARNAHPRTAALLRQCNRRSSYVITDYDLAVSVVNFGLLSSNKDGSVFNFRPQSVSRQTLRKSRESDTCTCCTPDNDYVFEERQWICLCCFGAGFSDLEELYLQPKMTLCVKVMLAQHLNFAVCKNGGWRPIEYLCEIGNPTAALHLLSQPQYDFTADVWILHIVLHKFAECNRLDIIKKVYEVCSQIDSPLTKYHKIFAYASTQNTESHNTFLHECAMLNLQKDFFGSDFVGWESPYLVHAVRQSLPDVLAMLLEVPGETANDKSQQALQLACEMGNLEMVKLLFDSTRPWLVGDDAGGDALRKGNVELFQWLMKQEALTCKCFPDLAELDEFEKLVEIERGPQSGRMDVEKIFERAVAFDRVDFLVRFCEEFGVEMFDHVNGWEPVAPFWEYETPLLTLAVSFGHLEMVNFLVFHHADVNAAGGAAIRLAAVEGKIDLVKALIGAGCDVNAYVKSNRREGYCPSALEEAVMFGHLELAKVLLEAGANVNAHGGVIFRRAAGLASRIPVGYESLIPSRKLARPDPAILELLLTYPTSNPHHIHAAFESLLQHILANPPNPSHRRPLKTLRRQSQLVSLFISTKKINPHDFIARCVRSHHIEPVRNLLGTGLVGVGKERLDKYGRARCGKGQFMEAAFAVKEDGVVEKLGKVEEKRNGRVVWKGKKDRRVERD